MTTIKQIKRELGITNSDIAKAGGYKNQVSYNNSGNGKLRTEQLLEWFYSMLKP